MDWDESLNGVECWWLRVLIKVALWWYRNIYKKPQRVTELETKLVEHDKLVARNKEVWKVIKETKDQDERTKKLADFYNKWKEEDNE